MKKELRRFFHQKFLIKFLGTCKKFLILIAFLRLAHAQLDVKLGVQLEERQIVGKEGHLLVTNTKNSSQAFQCIFLLCYIIILNRSFEMPSKKKSTPVFEC